jgi:hypothetical protein
LVYFVQLGGVYGFIRHDKKEIVRGNVRFRA